MSRAQRRRVRRRTRRIGVVIAMVVAGTAAGTSVLSGISLAGADVASHGCRYQTEYNCTTVRAGTNPNARGGAYLETFSGNGGSGSTGGAYYLEAGNVDHSVTCVYVNVGNNTFGSFNERNAHDCTWYENP